MVIYWYEHFFNAAKSKILCVPTPGINLLKVHSVLIFIIYYRDPNVSTVSFSNNFNQKQNNLFTYMILRR